jgi:hypothetical protein
MKKTSLQAALLSSCHLQLTICIFPSRDLTQEMQKNQRQVLLGKMCERFLPFISFVREGNKFPVL